MNDEGQDAPSRIEMGNINLIGVLVVGGLVYLILSYFNKGFDERDRKIFNEAIGKNIFVF